MRRMIAAAAITSAAALLGLVAYVNFKADSDPDGEVEQTTDAAMDAVADVVDTVINESI